LKVLLIISLALAWTVLCAHALAQAYRSGAIEARTGVVERAKRPRLFAVNIAGLWLALALGPAALVYAWSQAYS
jgi:hypothetical protein